MKKLKFLVIALVFFGFVVGCNDETPQTVKRYFLPDDAKEVKILGNDWVRFELDGDQYLYNTRYRIITAVPQSAKK